MWTLLHETYDLYQLALLCLHVSCVIWLQVMNNSSFLRDHVLSLTEKLFLETI